MRKINESYRERSMNNLHRFGACGAAHKRRRTDMIGFIMQGETQWVSIYVLFPIPNDVVTDENEGFLLRWLSEKLNLSLVCSSLSTCSDDAKDFSGFLSVFAHKI